MLIPAYKKNLPAGALKEKAAALLEHLLKCDICPRNCGVNRWDGEVGICGIARQVWISSYGPHHGEEDPIRGTRGSGTIFFSGCNLNCLYCQNAAISQKQTGVEIPNRDLADIMLELQQMGCHNINLVSPTHVVPQIVEAISMAAVDGLSLPIVYNTGGYDALSTLQYLEDIVDIYMPDMKYSDETIGLELSGIQLYPAINQKAVLEMHRQVGDLKLSSEGIAERGLLIRHLVLPNGLAGSQKILDFIFNQISADTYLNLMDQYRPAYRAQLVQELDRKVHGSEFKDVVQLAETIGLSRLDKRYY